MTPLILDTGVLGRLCHKNVNLRATVEARLKALVQAQSYAPHVSSIVDYELRRELLRLGSRWSLRRLDELRAGWPRIEVATPVLDRAAQLWADARLQGKQGAADGSLDADLILAAQAIGVGGAIVTTNPDHLMRFVHVEDWSDLTGGSAP